MKKFIKPSINVISYNTNILCISTPSSPSEREHGNGPGNGKGWGTRRKA